MAWGQGQPRAAAPAPAPRQPAPPPQPAQDSRGAQGGRGKSNLVKIGALWAKTSKKDGAQYFTGQIQASEDGQELSIMVFANRDTSNPRAPQYTIHIDPEKPYREPKAAAR